jgi:hypothetical protein
VLGGVPVLAARRALTLPCAAWRCDARSSLAQAHQREVVIGASSMLTPYQYVSNLKNFKKLELVD